MGQRQQRELSMYAKAPRHERGDSALRGEDRGDTVGDVGGVHSRAGPPRTPRRKDGWRGGCQREPGSAEGLREEESLGRKHLY